MHTVNQCENSLRFVRMVFNGGQLGGERVLSPETVVSLGLNHMGDCRVYKLKAANPLTDDAEFFPGVQKSWSLAFQVNHEATPTGRPAGGLMWAAGPEPGVFPGAHDGQIMTPIHTPTGS